MANFEPSVEWQERFERVVSALPVRFGHIDTERVCVMVETDMEPKRKVAYVEKLKPAERRLNPKYDYRMVIHEKRTEDYDENQKDWLVVHEASHIGETSVTSNGVEKITVIRHDVEDFFDLILVLGPNYLVREDLPPIESLKERINVERSTEEEEED